ncbi:hypothetical protein Bresa_01625|uniref:Uncharacterized protein n=1 Tax=Brenneria salicis ATCC 15712 = DSM 30166 TaxID=714314 RepID=A0A366I6V2_9GAMM|nr:hypothetical protein [Brenneria salicis ATCC 15712 = DSM 30166]RBP62706.1 hypothetical protein DES54_11543 [Brenneria salicis ATCC 15712 = DSM 30166]
MSMVVGCGRRSFPVCSGFGSDQEESGSGRAEGVGRREGKIKADGTLWVRSGGQALVCTLFGTAPPLGRHGAAGCRKPGIRHVFNGTLARNRRFRADFRR